MVLILLLVNLHLNELDKELTKRGHKFVRYVDDCNVYAKSKRAAERMLAKITKFLKEKLKVKINREKIQVGSFLRLKYLGFSLIMELTRSFIKNLSKE